ncbi:MAG: ABC transporter ATP-binding protein [Actinomycetaceae bacterium]|nr:ABC transporter ATP-binding protein [Actinomycetaceae bacterium]
MNTKHDADTVNRATENSRSNVLIYTEKLSKSFSVGGVQQHVLRNVDLEIYDGDFTVIMGPSGAGKSTLLYALSGMDSASLGRIVVDGTDITDYSPDKLARFRRTTCGFVFQKIELLDGMSIHDNAMAMGLLAGGNRREVAKRADELFDQVGIDAATRGKAPGMLSGGEAQRAAIVRATIHSPKVLFADEPTGQLNSEYGTKVLDLMSAINERGQSILMVTHDQRSAARANRILYLRDGAIHGELQLARWHNGVDETTRMDQLATFLAEMGW